MLIKPGLAVSEMSGKFGGVVAAHNRFGQYLRQYRIPTDPTSPSQMLRRAAMAAAVVAWRALAQMYKDQWDVYAANTPWINRIGETVYLNGFQHYVRVYTFMKYMADEIGGAFAGVAQCNSTGGLPENISSAVATVSVATGLSLAYDDTADWCDTDGAACLIQMSRPRPASAVYGNGPYKYCTAIVGDSVAPPTTPATLATASLPWAIAIGDRVDFLARLLNVQDYTLSAPLKISAIVVA